MKLSNRINKIEESGIRKIFELAAKNKGEYINLSIGQPHFETPKILKEQAQKAIENNQNSYSPTMGIPKLRQEIARKLEVENGIKTKTDQVIVTTGVAGGIFLALSVIINPGDEVILPDPYFVLYKQVLNYLGAKIVFLDTYPDFDIDSRKLEELISKKTKLIIINSPNNPTGKVYSEEVLKQVAEIARKNEIFVLSDEIYEKFDYDNKFFSIGSVYNKTITLNGFSKSHSVTGWRVGYAQGPLEIIEAMNKLQQYSFVCAPSFAQQPLADNFDLNLDEEIEIYKKNKELVYEELRNDYQLNESQGAFYYFIKKPAEIEEFNEKLVENKLLTVPGEVFSEKSDYFRLSFAVDSDKLKQGLKILKKIKRIK